MKNIKKILSLTLCLFLILGISTPHVHAATDVKYSISLSNFTPDLTSNTITADINVTFEGTGDVPINSFEQYIKLPSEVSDVKLDYNQSQLGFTQIDSDLQIDTLKISAFDVSNRFISRGSVKLITKVTFTFSTLVKETKYDFAVLTDDDGYSPSFTDIDGNFTYALDKTSVNFSHTVPACIHTPKEHPKKDATCTEDGNKQYWECTTSGGCGKIYSDSACTTETTMSAVTIPKLGHHMTTTEKIAEVSATCTKKGTKAHYHCDRCNKNFEDAAGATEITDLEIPIDASKHNIEEVKAVAPTCTKAGNKQYWKCKDCGKLFSDDKGKNATTLAEVTIPATGA